MWSVVINYVKANFTNRPNKLQIQITIFKML